MVQQSEPGGGRYRLVFDAHDGCCHPPMERLPRFVGPDGVLAIVCACAWSKPSVDRTLVSRLKDGGLIDAGETAWLAGLVQIVECAMLEA